jgi:hypothetical protein
MASMAVPADPSWEPLQFADVLDMDGIYFGKVVGEKPTENGVWLTIECQDEDVAGRRLQKLLPDITQKPKATFLWRGLILSATSATQPLDVAKQAARAAFNWQPGQFLNAPCYFKVESYYDDKGDRRSGVQDWLPKQDHDAAKAAGKMRWSPKADAPARTTGFGAPAGLPQGFPVPGAVPMPPAAAPIQTAPPVAVPPSAPPAGFPAPAPVAAPPTLTAVPPPQASPFAFPGMK